VALTDDLRRLGASIHLEAGELRCRYPAGVITDGLRQSIAEHRAELLLLLDPDRLALVEDGRQHGFGWREEWAAERGLLADRVLNCDEPDVTARLRVLLEEAPKEPDEWLSLGKRIQAAEAELLAGGRLPVTM
jgi:hypothetical protein